MRGWESDKRWSDRFLPEIKRILGEHLIAEPPVCEDQERNSDLMVLKLDSVRVGCRVRRFDYLSRYGQEFTIRAERGSGNKTELQKVIEGWGDYFFYAFSDEYERGLSQWVLIDLYALRWHIFRNRQALSLNDNYDGSSRFASFRWTASSPFLVASSRQTTAQQGQADERSA